MSKGSYRNFLRLFEKWVIDEAKAGSDRDLGKHLRNSIATSYSQGSSTIVNEKECNRIYESLNRIANNIYFHKYMRTRKSTSTGLTPEQCKEINSDNFRKAIKMK